MFCAVIVQKNAIAEVGGRTENAMLNEKTTSGLFPITSRPSISHKIRQGFQFFPFNQTCFFPQNPTATYTTLCYQFHSLFEKEKASNSLPI